jgi:hypothetical protein
MSHLTFSDPNSIEARQALLDGHSERKHPKRHRTAKRKSRASALKKLKAKQRAVLRLVAMRKFNAATRAYWAGERDAHP